MWYVCSFLVIFAFASCKTGGTGVPGESNAEPSGTTGTDVPAATNSPNPTTDTTDTAAPTASLSPAASSSLSPSDSIVIRFSESMATSSISVGGDLGAEATATWSQTRDTNDTLTLGPATNWTVGNGKTLTLSARDSAGNALTAISVSYNVISGVIYVHPSGSDGNAGTAVAPKLTIQGGIDAADSLYSVGEVRVAQGTYSISSAISLAWGISVYGGYKSDDWGIRDASLYTTTITDTRSSGGSSASPLTAVFMYSSGNGLVFDGFTVNAGTGDYSAAFRSSSAYAYTVSHCTLNGGGGSTRSSSVHLASDVLDTAVITSNTLNPGTSPLRSYGIYAAGTAATISSNTVTPGSSTHNYGMYLATGTYCTVSNNTVTAGSGSNSYGIYSATTACTFSQNTIDGGSGSTASHGMYLTNSSAPYPTVRNNTINGGSGGSSYGIYNATSSKIEKNRIHGGTGTNASYGIYNNGGDGNIQNNLIYGGTNDNSTYGVYFMNPSSPKLQNNTINGGSAGLGVGDSSVAINYNGSLSPKIQNNILFTSSGTTRRCLNVTSMSAGGIPAIENNFLFSCPTNAMFELYSSCSGNADGDGSSQTCNVDDLNNMGTISVTWVASGNAGDNATSTSPFVDIDGTDDNVSTMADNDWHLTAGSASAVRTGGIDGGAASWIFGDDFAGTTRTSNWSIGAYEKD